MPGISISAALAGWLPVSGLWRAEGLGIFRFHDAVLALQLTDYGYRRNDLSVQLPSSDVLVPGGVVGHQPEERGERDGVATGAGTEELQDGLDAAAQTAARPWCVRIGSR